MNFYKNFKTNLNVSIKSEERSLVKWSCELEKASVEVPDPNTIKDFAVKTFQDLDAYIVSKV